MAEGYVRQGTKVVIKDGGNGSGKTVRVKKSSYGSKRK